MTVTRRDRRILVLCLSLALVLIGGTLGTWTYSALYQRRTAEALIGDSITNRVYYDFELDERCEEIGAEPPGPEWLRDRVGLDFLATVAAIKVGDPSQSSVELAASFPALRSLDLTGSKGRRAVDLRPLHNTPHLERLVLRNVTLGGDRLAVLAQLPRLRLLVLQQCQGVDDGQFDYVPRAAGLTKLVVIGCGELTDVGLAKVGELKNLETLVLDPGRRSTDEFLGALVGLDRLRELSLDYGLKFRSSGGLRHLAQIPHLEEISLSKVTDDALAAAGPTETIKALTLHDCPRLGEVGLRNLLAFPNLERLSLSAVPALDDATLTHLSGLAHLRDLDLFLPESLLTDAGIAHLVELKQLEKLHISIGGKTAVSSAAIEKLRKELPGCQIRSEGR